MDEGVRVQKPKHKRHIWVYMFLIFVGIMLFLVYSASNPTSFAGKITGNVVKGDNPGPFANPSQVSAELRTSDVLEINSHITKVNLKIKGPANFNMGSQKIVIAESDSASVVMDNFDGKVVIYPDSRVELDGTTNMIFFDGVPISSGSGINVKLNKDSVHSYLKLDDFYLPSRSYETSGQIDIDNGRVLIRSDGEVVKLPDFQGNLEMKKGVVRINGVIKRSEVGRLLEGVSG